MSDGADPCGIALEEYLHGKRGMVLEKRYSAGVTERIPVEAWFRPPDLYATDACALKHCRGRVLDVGAGCGQHARYLERAGHDVTAIDVLPEAVAIMQDLGLADVRKIDFLKMPAERYDTLLFLGRTIGFAGSVTGLDTVLRKCRALLRPGGQVLLTSLDVGRSAFFIQSGLARDGTRSVPGEVRFAFAYGSVTGQEMPWFYVSPDVLRTRSVSCGFDSDVLCDEGDGNYLARLERSGYALWAIGP